MPTILFICTANRHRSPIAAAAFLRELQRRNIQESWQVLSAGTWATDGMPAAPSAVVQAKRLGLDISDHRSGSISRQLMCDADLVVVMEAGQHEALKIEFPEYARKIHLLSEGATGVAYDIPDPASSLAAGEIEMEINELVHQGFDRLCLLATDPGEKQKSAQIGGRPDSGDGVPRTV